jgi:hypothetical protein
MYRIANKRKHICNLDTAQDFVLQTYPTGLVFKNLPYLALNADSSSDDVEAMHPSL